MLVSRRDLLASAAATAVAAPAWAASDGDKQINNLFTGLSEMLLTDSPETATALSLDKGPRAALKSRLSDSSWAHVSQDHVTCGAWLSKVNAIPAAGLSPAAALNKAVVAYALELGRDGGKFTYGTNTLNSAMGESSTPYVVSQETGSFVGTTEFLDSQHQIDTRADCDAYLGRMEAYARALDAETDRIKRDAGQGVILPDFLLNTALGQMQVAQKVPAAQQRIVTSLTSRAGKKNLGDYAARATKITADNILPALNRQVAALQALKPKATHDAGVWKFKDGEAY